MSILGEAAIHTIVIQKEQEGKLETLRTLINNNASLENLDANGWTALHHAANNGDLSCCKLLVKSGAEVNCMSNKRRLLSTLQLKGALLKFSGISLRTELR